MLIRLQSMTITVKVQKRLRAEGIQSELIQAPMRGRQGGCSYALRIAKENLAAAERTARGAAARIVEVIP